MTLRVNVYFFDADRTFHWLDEDPPMPRSNSFGAEGWRRAIWGSPKVKALGLCMLPSLEGTDISAEGPDLDRLEHELDVLRAAVPTLYPDLDEQESIIYRLDNVDWAISVARARGGGVSIG